jgi:D-3-phosphoglycerate dehydrogenase / 2-oxoglutarate reductase
LPSLRETSTLRRVPRAHVLLNENIHESADDAFARADIRVYRNKGGLAGEALVAALLAIPGDEPLLLGIRSKTQVRAAVLDAVPRLAAVGAFCIGTDQVDVERARQLGIAVFNAPFSNTRSVAELVLAEIVILSRQIFARSMAAHEGRWLKDAEGAHEVRGKRLGIVGYGHIGSQLSILAEALGMRVSYYDVINKLPLGNAVPTDSLDALLRESDFVTLHVPDTEQTRGMIGAKQLYTLRRGAYLINASRGTVVDIDALAAAIDAGHVAGAAIDVYPKEPDTTGDRFESPLQGMPEVILTPHIGGSTQEAQANIGREVSEALCAYMTLGRTTSCITLPAIDATELRGGCRLVNVHDDVPGVLSRVTAVVAQVGVNITGQHLVTGGGRGLLLMDIALPRSDARANALRDGIAKLDHSLRTQLLG